MPLNEVQILSRDKNLILPAVILMFSALLVGLVFLGLENDLSLNLLYPNSVFWMFLTFIVTVAPLVFYWYKGRFDLFNPIIFAAWSYFIPVFAVGGLIFTSGFFQPYYSYLIQDPKNDIPLTFIYVITGFLGLWAGYEIPLMKKIGEYCSAKLPVWNWDVTKLILPGFVLLGIGIIFNVTTWMAGILMGFQTGSTVDALDNLQYFLSLMVLEGSFLLWLVVFKIKKRNTLYYLTLTTVLIVIPLRSIFAGSRGSLYQLFLMVAMAYFFSGKTLNLKKGMIFAGFLIGAIMIGMIWGNTFRTVKGDDTKISSDEYLDVVGKTADSISSISIEDSLSSAVTSFSERLENFSALAVVVSNYEKLAPYEEAYGLKDNIWTYTWTAFIPRVLWQDKPIVSGARAYSELYYNYGDNAFPITPIGDLLRNFGSYGIPLGMFVLGMFLRFLYVLFIEDKQIVIWCGMAYFMIISKVSYEGFYGTILPDVIRTVFIILISLIIIRLIVSKGQK